MKQNKDLNPEKCQNCRHLGRCTFQDCEEFDHIMTLMCFDDDSDDVNDYVDNYICGLYG